MGLLQTYTGKKLECGVDEVGRGCLCGPVVACAVILPHGFFLADLRDSKKMSHAKRVAAAKFIRSVATISVAEVGADRIDKVNILNATFEAMHAAIAGLPKRPEHIICDGNIFRPYEDIPHTTFVKGDDLYSSIAAASVVAKVYRDSLMDELSKEYPGYEWHTNKGYGTSAHVTGLRSLGLTKHHRKTFIGQWMMEG